VSMGMQLPVCQWCLHLQRRSKLTLLDPWRSGTTNQITVSHLRTPASSATLQWQPQILQNSDKVKVKFTLEQAIKAQRGSRGIALLFL
jgi:hypothetical protein